MANEDKKTRICKIVYFDDASVTDYIQIVKGGKFQQTTQLLDETQGDGGASVAAGASIGTKGFLKSLLGIEANAEIKSELSTSFSTNQMAKNILKNTILTDFITLMDTPNDEDSKENNPITKFIGYKLNAPKDSMTYVALISPYLSMLRGGNIPAGEFNIAIDKLDSTLKNAKGYYEFVGSLKENKVIFRFNINAFKNNYKATDLQKMDISIYAIKVGKSTISKLNFNNEFEIDDFYQNKDNPDYIDEQVSEVELDYETELEVYDVLLAGVEIK